MVQKKKLWVKKTATVEMANSQAGIESLAFTQTESKSLLEKCEPTEERELIEGTNYTIEDLLDTIAKRNGSKRKEPELETKDAKEAARLQSVLDNVDRILAEGGIKDLDEYGHKLAEERVKLNRWRRLRELGIDEMLKEE